MGDVRRLHQLVSFNSLGFLNPTPDNGGGAALADVPGAPLRPLPRKALIDSPWIPLFAFVVSAAFTSVALSADWRFSVAAWSHRAYLHPASYDQCVYYGQQNCVLDGDTFRSGGVTIRIADLDAPSTIDFSCAAERLAGQRAARRLSQVLNAGPFDIAPAADEADTFGRKLRVITRAGESIAPGIIAEGFARAPGSNEDWC